MGDRIPSTTVTGLLEAAENGSMSEYYYARWAQTVTPGRNIEWVGTVLGRLADRGLIDWSGSVDDCTLTEKGKAHLAWLRGGRKGRMP